MTTKIEQLEAALLRLNNSVKQDYEDGKEIVVLVDSYLVKSDIDTIRDTLTQSIAIERGESVVVPREPDEKMICAAFEQCDGYNAKYYRDLYKAMIAAQEDK